MPCAKGRVQHRVLGVVEAATVGARKDTFRVDVEVLQVRLVGDEFHRAAHGAGAIQGALWAAQNLDTVQVEQRGIDDNLAILGHGGRRQRRLIEIESHGGRFSAGGGQAAHFELGLAGTGGFERQAGHLLSHFQQVGDALRLQVGTRDGGQADGSLLHRRIALLRGHDDFLQIHRPRWGFPRWPLGRVASFARVGGPEGPVA